MYIVHQYLKKMFDQEPIMGSWFDSVSDTRGKEKKS